MAVEAGARIGRIDIKIFPDAIRRLLEGPVRRDMRRRARRVETAAKSYAPQGMRKYIRATPGARPGEIDVVCTHPATQFVISGTRSHVIRPRYRSVLKFTTQGKTVFTRVVHHPGTKPNDFLGKALRQAL